MTKLFFWPRLLLLAALVFFALWLRYPGVVYSTQLHPDENRFQRWMIVAREHGYLKGDSYAGGYFVLANTVRVAIEKLVLYPWHQFKVFAGLEPRNPGATIDEVVFGRHFNIWVGALTVVPIFLLVRRSTGSTWGATLAAMLFALAPYHIEHCHYLESDIAMLAVLVLAVLCWVCFLDQPGIPWLVGAALVSGFAAGTKYYLVLLAPVMGACIWASGSRQTLSCKIHWALLALLLFALGFALATPAIFDAGFFSHLLQKKTEVFEETGEILGLAQGLRFARLHLIGRCLLEFLQSVGWGWMLLVLLGLGCALAAPWRRYWPVTVFFPLLYLAYLLGLAPWARSQEMLVLRPFLGLLGVLPWAALANAASRPRRRWIKAGLLIATLLAAWPIARNGRAMMAIFSRPDTRLLAQQWLRRHYPFDKKMGVEIYTPPAGTGVAGLEVNVYKVAKSGLPFLAHHGCSYLLANADATGRGLTAPWTGQLFEKYAQRYAEFQQQAQFLQSWSLLPGDYPHPTFRSPRIELWGLAATTPGELLPVPCSLPRPLYCSTEHQVVVFNAPHQLGSALGFEVTRQPRLVALGGDFASGAVAYLILNTMERGMRFEVAGPGVCREVALSPYDAQALPFTIPDAKLPYAGFQVRALAPKSLQHIPAYGRWVFSLEEAVQALLDLRCPRRARELLQALARPGCGNDLVDYQLAVAEGNWPESERLLGAADVGIRVLEQLYRDDGLAAINGLPKATYADFARIRLGARDRVLPLVFFKADGAQPGVYAATGFPGVSPMYAPVLCPAGTCEVSVELGLAGATAAAVPEDFELALTTRDNTELARISGKALLGGAYFPVRLFLPRRERERVVRIYVHRNAPVNVCYRNLEIRWNLRDGLNERRQVALRAREKHQAAQAGGMPPGPPARVFGEFFNVRSAALGHEPPTLSITLEALQDATPPFALHLLQRRWGKWRELAAWPISPEHRLQAGECFPLAVPLPFPADKPARLRRLAIGIATAVEHHAGFLPVAETRQTRVRLSDLVDNGAVASTGPQ